MKAKTGAAKGVRLPAHPKVDLMAHEKLPDNPSVEELKTAAVSISLADLEERVADVRDSWEEDSLFEEVIEELTDDSVTATGGECQPFSFIHSFGIAFCLFYILIFSFYLGWDSRCSEISQVGGFWWVAVAQQTEGLPRDRVLRSRVCVRLASPSTLRPASLYFSSLFVCIYRDSILHHAHLSSRHAFCYKACLD
jgi:hypothetical protein